MYKIGWFSSGRDLAARDLLIKAQENIESGYLENIKIEFVFCNREKKKYKESDLFLKLASGYGFPIITFSSAHYKQNQRKKNIKKWREEFDREVIKRIKKFKVDLIVLAGYMLIVSPKMCKKYEIINLHPAKPGGPKGTWQEVIWQLIEKREKESGVMMHLVAPELDAGPALTFCTFALDVPYKSDNLWRVWDLFHEEWVKEKLFDWIRKEGLKREFPLIIETLRLLESGEIRIEKGKVMDKEGKIKQGYNLTERIDAIE